MSVLGGIWNFDGKPADREWLAALSAGTKQHGPDGEYFYFSGPVGMVYRPFHTTAESRREQQPWISALGNVIAWDGRLDNAGDVAHALGLPVNGCSAAAFALQAFERWGTVGLERLRGDFALSIWQPRERKLLLARDYFAVRPLFYHATRDRVIWCSDLARIVLQHGAGWTLDDSYIAGYLASGLEAEETPYREIRGVGAAAWVEITPDRVRTGRFWQLNPNKRRDHCKNDGDYEEMYRHLFRQSVRRRLVSDKPVIAQLSGGMDSSSIVCVADDLLNGEPSLAPRLDTITHYNDSEPTGDEREWAKYVEARRGRAGHHVNTAELASYRPAGPEFFIPVPGATEGMIRIQREYDRIAAESGARVLLSGLGGDEFTGGVPDPTPQLADLLLLGHWWRLAALLKRWSAVKKKPALSLAWQSLLLLAPGWARVKWSPRAKSDRWMDSDFARRQRIRERYARVYGSPRALLPTRRIGISVWKQLAGCNGSLLTIGQRETRLPFMDRDLVEFLTAIPEEQLLRPGFRRSLIRRALADIVPAEVLNRRLKAVAVRGPMRALDAYSSVLAQVRGQFEVARHGYADGAQLWEAVREASITRSDNLVGIIRVLGLEHWLRDSAASYSSAGCVLSCSGERMTGAPASRDFSTAAQAS